MNGRFFTVPFLCATALLCTSSFVPNFKSFLLPLGVVLIVGFSSSCPPIWSDENYGQKAKNVIDLRGVADERAFYYPTNGLLRAGRDRPPPAHQWAKDGRAARNDSAPVKMVDAIGMFGFYAGPRKHIVDIYGLVDPLLSRLPIPDPFNWRIGHFKHKIPPGYQETLISGRNQIADPALAEFYDHLTLITRGRLFDVDRFIVIWKMNTGQYNPLLLKHP